LTPAAILFGESPTVRQPDTNLGLGLALLFVLALAFWVIASVLQRD
jgi:hypothetical protein